MRKGLPQTYEEILEHFDPEYREKLTDTELETMRKNLFINCEYAFIEDGKTPWRLWCSHCREHFETKESLKHLDITHCPHCGETLLVKRWTMGIKHTYDQGLAYFYRKSVTTPGAITALSVAVGRYWGDYKEAGCTASKVPERITIDTYYVYIPGLGGVMARPAGGIQRINLQYYKDRLWFRGDSDWEVCKPGPRMSAYIGKNWGGEAFYSPATYPKEVKASNGAICNWKGTKLFIDDDGLKKAVEDSPLRYGLKEYAPYRRDAYTRWLDWTARYPSIEMLLKMGCQELVADQMAGYRMNNIGGAVNWRGKNIKSIFRGRLTKADKAYMRRANIQIDSTDLLEWQRYGGRVSMEDACILRIYRPSLERIKDLIDIKKAFYWLKRKGWSRKISIYADYIQDCARLHMDLSSKSVIRPKDVDAAHQNTIRQIQYLANKALDDRYQTQLDRLTKAYAYEAMGLVVVIPQSTSDLIAEGKAQSNCVGGYCERVANGDTDVVFIRHADNLTESYITMEIRNGKIVQARTKFNGSLDDLGSRFVEAFRQDKLERKQTEADGMKEKKECQDCFLFTPRFHSMGRCFADGNKPKWTEPDKNACRKHFIDKTDKAAIEAWREEHGKRSD